MTSKPIVIRCIADDTKGFGNLKRCLILAGVLKKNHKILFIVDNQRSAIKELKKKKLQFIIKPQTLPLSSEGSFITKIMRSINSEIVIVDMREFSENITKQLKDYPIKSILLDDAWCKNAYADVIFNGTLVLRYHNYQKKNKNCKIFVGTKYFIINQEFLKKRKKTTDITDKTKYEIVVSMGGSDPDDLTFFVTKSLLHLKNVKLKIILGPLYSKHAKLATIIKNKRNVQIISSPSKIWEKFAKADLAISNAGNTLFELAVLKIPTICIAAVEHQIPYAKEFARKGFAVNLGFWKNVNKQNLK